MISTERSPVEPRNVGVEEGNLRYTAQQLALNRALALAGIVTTLTIPLAFYARASAPDPASVPLIGPDGRGYYLASLLVVGIISVLIHLLEADDPARLVNRYGERIYLFRQPAPRTAWMAPAVALFTVYYALALHHHLPIVLLAPFVAGIMVFVLRLSRYQLVSNPTGSAMLIGVAQQLIIVGVALAAFAVVYSFRTRTLYAGPAMFILSFLLLLSAFDGLTAPAWRRMVYAAVGGLAVAQLVWGLNYWNTSGLIGGALLATVFAFYATVSRTHLGGGITQRQVIERAAFTAPVFVLLAYIAE